MSSSAGKQWAAHIAQLRSSAEGKALGVSLAIASELFLLKAENMKLRLALKQKGLLNEDDSIAIAAGADFNKWLQAEQTEFTRCIFKEWLVPDGAPDVSGEFDKASPDRI